MKNFGFLIIYRLNVRVNHFCGDLANKITLKFLGTLWSAQKQIGFFVQNSKRNGKTGLGRLHKLCRISCGNLSKTGVANDNNDKAVR